MINQDTIIISLKISLFIFIITSPFYNVGSAFSFLNNIFAKIILLGLIIAATFFDLQLAIIMAIAFFILMMNLNNQVISKPTLAPTLSPHEPIFSTYPHDVAQLTPAFSADPVFPFAEDTAQPFQHIPVEESDSKHELVMQNMYEFPPAECNTPKESNDAYMNQSMMGYYLDEKIKPYEDFVSQLTSEELLDSVSNGAYLVSEKNSL